MCLIKRCGIIVLVLLLGLSTVPAVAQESQFAPDSLKNLEITYTITDVQEILLPAEPFNYHTGGYYIETYTDTVLVHDGFNAHFFDYTGQYQFQKNTANSITYSIFSDLIVNTLEFTGPLKGNFSYSFAGGAGIVSGTFKAKQTQNVGLAPKNVKNRGFAMAIEQQSADISGGGFPQVGNSLLYLFDEDDGSFMRTDLYDDWGFPGEYSYRKTGEHTAVIKNQLDDSGRQIEIQLQYDSLSNGRWNAKVDGGNITLSGSFFNSMIEPPEDHDFEGTVLAKTSITSNITGITYPYRVYLPEDYYESDRLYPVIYATDGQWVFWDFSIAVDKHKIDAIVVAVEQGPVDRRDVDYQLPGSHQYLEFLKNELMPAIEAEYRASPENRTIQGGSLGAMLVAHAMYDSVSSQAFKNFIATDGAYFLDVAGYLALEEAALPPNSTFNANLYLAGATAGGLNYYVDIYDQRLRARNITGLKIDYQVFHLRHVQMALPGFETAVLDIFK